MSVRTVLDAESQEPRYEFREYPPHSPGMLRCPMCGSFLLASCERMPLRCCPEGCFDDATPGVDTTEPYRHTLRE